MIPLFFRRDATNFQTLGVGSLPDSLSCIVHEVRNGENTCELTLPITSSHLDEITVGAVLVVDTNLDLKRQAYDIYSVEKNLNGRVTVRANHISYRLRYSVLRPFSVNSAAAAMAWLNDKSLAHYINGNSFSFYTDVTTSGTVSFTGYPVVRDTLGGKEGTLLDIYGGVYRWDNYNVSLLTRRGQDNGVRIVYGKNLQALTDETDDSSLINGVWPVFTSGGSVVATGTKITLAEATPDAIQYVYARVITVDFADRFTSTPTGAQLDSAAAQWLQGREVPRRTLSAAFVPLNQTIEYKDLAQVEPVGMDDTVHLHVPAPFNVDASARVVETYYNVLKDRYEKIEIGDIRPTLADAIRAL